MNDVGSFSMFDKVIDVTFYKYIEKTNEGQHVWKDSHGNVTDSTKYTNENGDVFTVVDSGYQPTIEIHCSDTDIKPDIKLSFEAVPGRNVTRCELRITNLQVDVEDIRKWAMMKIVAGYRCLGTSYGKIDIYVNIFSAWTESPNPDGVTCIQGIATGSALGKFFGNRKFYIQFDSEEVTIRNLLSRLLQNEDVLNIQNFEEDVEKPLLRHKLTIKDSVKNEEREFEIGDLSIATKGIRVIADSGYQIIQWLSRELYEWGQNRGIYIYLNIFNDRVKICCVGEKDNIDTYGENVVMLKAIDSANYMGGLLTIKAPWVPSLIPGGLFHLESQYFSLQNTYRELSSNVFIDKVLRNPGEKDPAKQEWEDRGLYRVITSKVSFDTCGSDNTMEIQAISYNTAPDPWDAAYTADSAKHIDASVDINTDAALQKLRDEALLVTVVFGDDKQASDNVIDSTQSLITQGSYWAKLINSIDTFPLGETKIMYLNEPFRKAGDIDIHSITSLPSFNGADWFDLWRACTKIPDSYLGISKQQGYWWEPTDWKGASVPVLKRSECKKIYKALQRDGISVNDEMKNLLENRYLVLDCRALWPVFVACAFLCSYKEEEGWLYQTMNKEGFGQLMSAGINYPLLNVPDKEAQRLNVPIKAMGNKYLQRVSVSVPASLIRKDSVQTIVDIRDGGNRESWDVYKDYKDMLKFLIDDTTLKDYNPESLNWNMLVLWYYYFSEVRI